MARTPIRKSTKSAASRKSTAKSSARSATPVSVTARSVYLAGLGAAQRAQAQASKAYETLADKAGLVTGYTGSAAEKFAKQASALVKETVREGKKMQAQAQAAAQAQAKLTSAEISAFAKKSQKSFQKNVTKTVKDNVASVRANAMQGVANLEQVFETRVAKTLNTFGVPSVQDVRELQARMADLQKALNQLQRVQRARA